MTVWSKTLLALRHLKNPEFCNADEFIEGTGENTEEKEYIVTTTFIGVGGGYPSL
jgi:hypothetical protein